MTCKHVGEAKVKISKLINKMNDTNSCLYEELGPYLELEGARSKLRELSKNLPMDRYLAAFSVGVDKFTIKSIERGVLYNDLSDIFDELSACNCREEVSKKVRDVAVSEHKKLYDTCTKLKDLGKELERECDNLKEKNDKLDREVRDLRGEKKEKEEEVKQLEKNHNKEKLEWEKIKGDIQTEKARIEENLNNSSAQVTELTRKLNNSENQLSEKQRKIEELREERNFLREKLGTAGKELIEVLEWEQTRRNNEIELFANQRGIELRQLKNLRRRYKELIIAEENSDWNMFNEAEDNILAIKDNMIRIITIEEAQKICKKCKKIARLELKLGRMREQQRQREQQYEARQEVPTNH